ncbi:hypothetical protein KAR48_04750 [bacterium]|nr:hypothetical protein [bacterium]
MSALKMIVLFIGALFLFGCAQENTESHTVIIANGITTVHNHYPQWGNNPKIELQHHLTIGGADETNKNFIFSRLSDAALDALGNYYLVANDCIRIYDAHGQYCRTIGCRGQGPGEFNQPSQLCINTEGDLIVFETRSRRTQRIPLNTTDKDAIRIFYGIRYINDLLVLKQDKLVIADHSGNPPDAVDSSKHRVIITDKDFNTFHSFIRYRPFNHGEGMKQIIGFSAWNKLSIGSDSKDNIFVAECYENKIEKYTPEGELLLCFDRDLPYEVKKYVGEGYTDLHFVISTLRLEVDHKDRIWIQSYSDAHTDKEVKGYFNSEGSRRGVLRTLNDHFEVYTNDGQWVCTLDPFGDSQMRLLRIVGDKMLLRDNDRCALYVYRIVEK